MKSFKMLLMSVSLCSMGEHLVARQAPVAKPAPVQAEDKTRSASHQVEGVVTTLDAQVLELATTIEAIEAQIAGIGGGAAGVISSSAVDIDATGGSVDITAANNIILTGLNTVSLTSLSDSINLTSVEKNVIVAASGNATITSTGVATLSSKKNNVNLVAQSGDIQAISVSGNVVLEADSGDINLQALDGNLNIAVSGNINVDASGDMNLSNDGALKSSSATVDISSTGGDFNVLSSDGLTAAGQTVDISATTGGLTAAGSTVDISATAGGLTAAGSTVDISATAGGLTAVGQTVDISSTFGDFNVAAGGGLKASGLTVDISSIGGDLTLKSFNGVDIAADEIGSMIGKLNLRSGTTSEAATGLVGDLGLAALEDIKVLSDTFGGPASLLKALIFILSNTVTPEDIGAGIAGFSTFSFSAGPESNATATYDSETLTLIINRDTGELTGNASGGGMGDITLKIGDGQEMTISTSSPKSVRVQWLSNGRITVDADA